MIKFPAQFRHLVLELLFGIVPTTSHFQGELITEASNYNPLDTPCKSLTPEALHLSKQMTDDLLIVISAPRSVIVMMILLIMMMMMMVMMVVM